MPDMKFHHNTVGVETLESRRLLAAQIVNGELIATGTNVRDDIELRRVGIDDVQVTIRTGESGTLASQQTFDLDDFNRIRVLGLGGNDYLHVAGNASLPNLTLDGGNEFADEDVLQARSGRFVDGERILDNSGHAVVTFDDSPSEHIIHGTAGNDRIAVSLRNGEHFVELNASFAGIVTRTTAGENGFIQLDAGNGNDTIVIGDGFGIGGDSGIQGGGGNDFFDLAAGARPSNIFDGPGDDTIFARGGPENNGLPQISRIDPGGGVDTIRMDRQTELRLFEFVGMENVSEAQGVVYGNDTDNRITVRSSNTAGTTVFAGDGNDTVIGGPGPDKFWGEDGNDTLIGNGGNDFLDGGPGADSLSGGTGTNTLNNGTVDDDPQFYIRDRVLTVNGTAAHESLGVVRTGIDDVRVNVNGVTRTFDMDDFDRITINGGAGNDTLTAGAGVANLSLSGDAGNDHITGNELANGLAGEDGNDTLDGGAGNDLLFGGAGDDTITGGPGDDLFAGDSGLGDGNDTLFARDGQRDRSVDGDGGFDRAQVDDEDVVEDVEELLP